MKDLRNFSISRRLRRPAVSNNRDCWVFMEIRKSLT